MSRFPSWGINPLKDVPAAYRLANAYAFDEAGDEFVILGGGYVFNKSMGNMWRVIDRTAYKIGRFKIKK